MRIRQVNHETGEHVGEELDGRLPSPFVEILVNGSWLPLEPEDIIAGDWEITEISNAERMELERNGFFDGVERAKAKLGYS